MTTTYINGTTHLINDKNDIIELIRQHMGNDFADTCMNFIINDEDFNKIYGFEQISDLLTAPNGNLLTISDEDEGNTDLLIDIVNIINDYTWFYQETP